MENIFHQNSYNIDYLSFPEILSKTISDDFYPITIAEYIALQLSSEQIDLLFSSAAAYRSYLSTVAKEILPGSVILMNSATDVLDAAISNAKEKRIGAFLITEDELISILYDLILLAEEKVPIIVIILTSLESRELSRFCQTETIRKKMLQYTKQIFHEAFGSYLIINDRRTAGARIDRTFDVTRELSLSAIFEISEEVSHSFLPPHIYRKTIFNHEEHDLFLNTWATIFTRLHHTTTSPAIIIGGQIWKEEWLSILVKIAQKWQATLFLDPEIAGILSLEETGPYTPISNLPDYPSELFLHHDTLFFFGLESDHTWISALFDELVLQEETHHEFMSINTETLFFCDGKEPFQLFSLENFFRIVPDYIKKDLLLRKTNRESLSLAESQTTNSSLETLTDLLYRHNKQQTSFILLDLPDDSTEYFHSAVHHISTYSKPKNRSESWIKATLTGILEARKKELFFLVTSDSSMIEHISAWWNDRYEHYPTVKFVFILISNRTIQRDPHLLTNMLFMNSLQDLDAWLSLTGETFSSGFISIALSNP